MKNHRSANKNKRNKNADSVLNGVDYSESIIEMVEKTRRGFIENMPEDIFNSIDLDNPQNTIEFYLYLIEHAKFFLGVLIEENGEESIRNSGCKLMFTIFKVFPFDKMIIIKKSWSLPYLEETFEKFESLLFAAFKIAYDEIIGVTPEEKRRQNYRNN